MSKPVTRCAWVSNDPLYVEYHDREWGVPVHDDRKLFQMLILEGAQAGLSWITILKKRAHYRKVFDGFDPKTIALYDQRKVNRLLGDPGIVRNRLKVESAILNARCYLELCEHEGRFSDFLWQFVDGETVLNRWKTADEIPANSTQSDAMSKALKARGFRFVGTTICYAFMQAVGMVNDHTIDCDFRGSHLHGSV
jgi:DNA-3-methyladenine glycosylase I